MHRQHRVEQMCEADALGLGNQAEECTVSIKAPRPALFDQFQTGLVVTVKQLVGDFSGGGLVGQFQRFGAKPLDADHAYQGVRDDAADRRVGLELFEFHG